MGRPSNLHRLKNSRDSANMGRDALDFSCLARRRGQTGVTLPSPPRGTGVDGPVVERAYKLDDTKARVGATLVQ